MTIKQAGRAIGLFMYQNSFHLVIDLQMK